jgi:two-component system cell cycle sensor histidine kinase/response regulator CckA
MSDIVMAKIFDPYYSTKLAGHGLGLSIVYSIIQKHVGHINVRSGVDAGAIFNFYLPTALLHEPVLEIRQASR